jgi:membrane associated rhomboid family serine protease
MIPLRHTVPSSSVSVVTIGLIAMNVLVFGYQLSLGPELNGFVVRYGAIPLRFILAGHIEGVSILQRYAPLFTSMFLHGGFMHLFGNMLYLWIFGNTLEDRLGHGRFGLLYVLCGLGADLTQIALDPSSRMPIIGASGAVAGVLGASLWLFPHARIVALVPIMFFWRAVEVPAMFFLLVWFLMQVLSGAASLTATHALAGGVAWWAHIGGFVSGMVLGVLLSTWKRVW